MNCDQVFDRLTCGPFPAGKADDNFVEQHLRACHECRQLAEALRPAVGLFHEAIEEESAALPSYHRETAQPVAALAAPAQHKTTTNVRRRRAAQLLPIGLMAAAAAFIVWFAVAGPMSQPNVNPWNAAVSVPPAAMIHLASLELPATCMPPTGAIDSTHCCTSCHNAAVGPQAKPTGGREIATLTSSCFACHSR